MPDTISEQAAAALPEPRISSTHKTLGIGAKEVKQAASFVLGAWALKKFPKIAIFGLIGVGVVLGLTIKAVAKRVDETSAPSPDHLH